MYMYMCVVVVWCNVSKCVAVFYSAFLRVVVDDSV